MRKLIRCSSALFAFKNVSFRSLHPSNLPTYHGKPPYTHVSSEMCKLFDLQTRGFHKLGMRRLWRVSRNLSTIKNSLTPEQKERNKRKPTQKISLRKAALQAETSRIQIVNEEQVLGFDAQKKIVTAYCGAQKYDLKEVERLLCDLDVKIDPTGTSLYPQVIHIEMPVDQESAPLSQKLNHNFRAGDVFIFPSGTVVGWDIPESNMRNLITNVLSATAQSQHGLEDEDFEYLEDRTRERSTIRGGTIILGTKGGEVDIERTRRSSKEGIRPTTESQHPSTRKVLAKIAFSSGLARSTKIAVLENILDGYLEDTKHISTMLMNGNLGALPRSFIYQKMGQLLSIRGQLNLSSDITDSLPDLLWDTEAELGLESYYDRISRALDTTPRIESLNQKMDYAHEIASILREELRIIHDQNQERTSTRLEWIIIALIAVEVGFGCWHLYAEFRSEGVTSVRIVK